MNSMKLSWRKWWVTIADSFLVRGGSSCLVPPLSTGTLSDLNPCSTVPAAIVSMSTYVPKFIHAWKTLLSWSFPPPFALTIFLPPILCMSLNPEGRELVKTSHLEVNMEILILNHMCCSIWEKAWDCLVYETLTFYELKNWLLHTNGRSD